MLGLYAGIGVVCGHGLSVLCGCQACPLPGLAGVLRRETSFTNLDLRGRLEESCPVAKLSKIPSQTHSGKRERRKTAKKKKKKKDCFFSLAEMVCQGFAGENYARRASFSTVKRRCRLTLTGRRRQATFAGVFVFDIIINSLQHRNWANNISQIVKFAIFVSG